LSILPRAFLSSLSGITQTNDKKSKSKGMTQKLLNRKLGLKLKKQTFIFKHNSGHTSFKKYIFSTRKFIREAKKISK